MIGAPMMNHNLQIAVVLVWTSLFVPCLCAQSLESQLSNQETYVGQPIMLQIQISDATEIDSPQLPNIDGLDLKLAGTPARSSRISIINGRRSESSSVLFNCQITPRRAGTFTIPPIKIKFDGREKSTPEYRFNVAVSETGDLMFVEIVGPDKPVYVGQPVKLTLKFWLKPFVDPARNLKLSEAHMWQLMAASSNWGPFQKRLEELLANNQRLTGQEVSRMNAAGESTEYYRYEIESTVYPQRPGKIDVGDVQIVANYPTELGEARNQLSLFGDDDDFGSTLMQEFFRDSPQNRKSLVVTATRPIAVTAARPALEVIDVPTVGRPADYRGAVGKYRIVTQAQPTEVTAGAPITLQMILQGDGPMELVQAPPLATLSSLTDDFKVEDDVLAGFVQDDAKLFTTTIRPRRERIKQIPPIPFSFFNPETEKFETVFSDSISIRVKRADLLALDSIVSNAKTKDRATESPGNSSDTASSAVDSTAQSPPDLGNVSTDSILTNAIPKKSFEWLLFSIPPLLCGLLIIVTRRHALLQLLWSRQPVPKTIAAIRRAKSPGEIAVAIQELYGSSMPPAIADVISRCHQAAYSLLESVSTDELKSAAITAVRQVSPDRAAAGSGLPRTVLSRMLIWFVLSVAALVATADSIARVQSSSMTLNVAQQRTILDEANDLYAQALKLKTTDAGAAGETFSAAIAKYQTVATDGIHSPELMLNLGNAYVQINELGLAIASYEQALRWDAYQFRAVKNLTYARSLLASPPADRVMRTMDWRSLGGHLVVWNRWIPARWVGWLAVVCWCLTWSLVGWRLLFSRPRFFGLLMCSSALFVLTTLSLALSNSFYFAADGVATNLETELRQGDGSTFPVVGKVFIGEGVELLDQRGKWVRVKPMRFPESGWVPRENVYLFAADSKRQ